MGELVVLVGRQGERLGQEAFDGQMSAVEALVATLLTHNAALQREIDLLQANAAHLERRLSAMEREAARDG